MECNSSLSLTLYFHQCVGLEMTWGLLTKRKILFWNTERFHFPFLFLCPHPLKGTRRQKLSLLGLLRMHELKYLRCASEHNICTFPGKKKKKIKQTKTHKMLKTNPASTLQQ